MELSIRKISKTYDGNIHALSNLSMDITSGILGLLGPNGAGKSTLMNIISTIIKPDCGEITLNDVNIIKKPQELRRILGYLPQDFGIYKNLNAIEFLKYIGILKGIEARSIKKRIDELLEIVNLYDVRKRLLGSYSGGMKQRIGIAQALINDPKVLIFDEPTVGLDPEERVSFRNMIANLSSDRIVILSTHIVSDLESIATKIAIVNKGKLIKLTTTENLLSEMEGKVWEGTFQSEEFQMIKNNFIVSNSIHSSNGIIARVIYLNKPIVGKSHQVLPKLEDAYLLLTSSEREVL